jgi:TRAP-type C4-dicarboxylate transport system substrate-binding protein
MQRTRKEFHFLMNILKPNLFTHKRLCFVGIAGAISIALAGCSGSGGASESVETLRFAHYLPDSHLVSEEALEVWMDKVMSRSDEIKFDYYPASQLVDATEIVASVREGVVDVAFFVPANTAGAELPLSDVPAVPGFAAASDNRVAQMAYQSLLEGVLFEEDFSPIGLRPLMGLTLGAYQLQTNGDPVSDIEGWKGLTLRSTGGVNDFFLNEVGAAPASLTVGEVSEGVQRGTIDGTLSGLVTIKDYDLDEVINSASVNLPLGNANAVLVINEEAWQGLSEDAQEALQEAAAVAAESYNEAFEKEDASVISEFSDIDFYEVDDALLADLTPAMEAAQGEWVDRAERGGKPGQKVLDAWGEALRQAQGDQ